MAKEITATFSTRRDAEMAIEHAVQEHGMDRAKIGILPVSERNSSGTLPAGGDLEAGGPRASTAGEPELAGRLSVTATVGEALVQKVRSSFETYGGRFAA